MVRPKRGRYGAISQREPYAGDTEGAGEEGDGRDGQSDDGEHQTGGSQTGGFPRCQAVFLAVGGADDPHNAAGHCQGAEEIGKAETDGYDAQNEGGNGTVFSFCVHG